MPSNQELLDVLNRACAEMVMPDLEDIDESLDEIINEDTGRVLEFMQTMKARAQNSPQGSDVEKHLRYFFRVRWAMIADSPVDYLRFTKWPANKRCVMLAEVLAGPEESIAKILMPTLKLRDYVAGGLMELTETEDEQGMRRLAVNNTFLLMQNNTTLFPLMDWAEYQTNPSEPFYKHLYHENGEAVPLAPEEITQIIDCSPAHPLSLTDQMDHYRALRRSQRTLYGVLSRLIDGLRRSGVTPIQDPVARAARDSVAAPEADASVVEFFEVWNAVPESEQVTAVLALRAQRYTPTIAAAYGSREQYESFFPTLEEYLAVLRHGAGLPCTDRQTTLANTVKFINCVEVIAKGLENIRDAHPEGIEKIMTTQAGPEVPNRFEQSFDEVKREYIADLDDSKHEVVYLDADRPDHLLDYSDPYSKFIRALQSISQELSENYLPIVECVEDILFALNFLSDEDAKRLLNACSQEMKDELLIEALEEDNLDAAVLAIDSNADLNIDYYEHDLLTAFLLNGWETLTEAILKRNIYAIADTWVEGHHTPLHHAFELGLLGFAAKIIDNLKRHANDFQISQILNVTNPSNATVIDLAFDYNGTEGVKVFGEAFGEDIFYNVNVEGKSLIHLIAENNDVESLRYVLSHFTSEVLNLVNEAYQTPLHIIVSHGYRESLDCLMDSIPKGEVWDRLMQAKEGLRQSALHLATAQGHKDILEKLLEHTNPQIGHWMLVDNNLSAQSCIQIALINRRLDIALLLLNALAPNSLFSAPAYTRAFDYALHQKNPEMILGILQSDLANVLVLEKLNTALTLAMELEEPALAAALIRKNASLGVTFQNSTVLHLALRRNWPEVLTALLERPDDLKSIMKIKNTHHRVALEVVHPEVSVELRQRLEALVKRHESSPPSSPNHKKRKTG